MESAGAHGNALTDAVVGDPATYYALLMCPESGQKSTEDRTWAFDNTAYFNSGFFGLPIFCLVQLLLQVGLTQLNKPYILSIVCRTDLDKCEAMYPAMFCLSVSDLKRKSPWEASDRRAAFTRSCRTTPTVTSIVPSLSGAKASNAACVNPKATSPHKQLSTRTTLTAVVVPATYLVLVAFKNRSSESDSDARVMVIVSPHSEVVNWDDGRATASGGGMVNGSWAILGGEHGASGDKANEGREAGEDGELHLVENVETEYQY
ncbi:hypothetical protein C8F01DRAFT_1089621 [Mycena amicta]|nr:hypothetical protein C8F01DRAFT_1089621 [Mycena amicta]